MRFKLIFLCVMVILFFALQNVPLMAIDKPYQPPTIVNPEYDDPGDGDGDGDEHPWEDNDDDDDATGFNKQVKFLISMFTGFFKTEKKASKSSNRQSFKNKGKSGEKFIRQSEKK
jgi:hypothetical protein